MLKLLQIQYWLLLVYGGERCGVVTSLHKNVAGHAYRLKARSFSAEMKTFVK